MNKFANCLMLAATLLGTSYPVMSYADEKVTTVHEGEVVPFDGTLFNTAAAARLMVDLEFSAETCQLDIDKAVSTIAITKQIEIDTLTVKLDTCQTLCAQRLQFRDEQIDILTQELQSYKKHNSTAWFAAGTVAGIGLTVLSGWAIGQAASP